LGDNVLTNEEILLGLPGYQITGIAIQSGEVRISVQNPAVIVRVCGSAARAGIAARCATRTWDYGIAGWR
jgi:hypothetical protein